jgi:hypothetical protein
MFLFDFIYVKLYLRYDYRPWLAKASKETDLSISTLYSQLFLKYTLALSKSTFFVTGVSVLTIQKSGVFPSGESRLAGVFTTGDCGVPNTEESFGLAKFFTFFRVCHSIDWGGPRVTKTTCGMIHV